MECQNTTKNLKINKNKSIGQVIIVVEGESEEFKLLRYIFTKVLNYNYVSIKRNKIMKEDYKSKINPNSTVIVANTSSSNIKSIMEDKNYQDKLYNLIKKEYNESLKSVPIYIIWDRDYDSNEKSIILKVLNTYKNAQDNNYDMDGLLLLSYPCIESYEISNFNKQLYKRKFKNSEDAKKLFREKRYSLTDINENTIINAINNMHRSMENIGILNYDPSKFYKVNKKIFDYQSNIYQNNKLIPALSLISVMLVDLGIISEEK